MNLKKDVTIYNISLKLARPSATVSRRLQNNPAVNKNILNIIQEAACEPGYSHHTFTSSLRIQKTNTIGIIVHDLKSNFMTSVPAGIEKMPRRFSLSVNGKNKLHRVNQ